MRGVLTIGRSAWLLAAACTAALLITSANGARSITTYGVSVSKGCNSPTFVGQQMQCLFVFGNTNPAVNSGDTVTIDSLSDVVTSAGGPVSTGNVLSQLQLVASPAPGTTGAPTCTGPTLTGNGSLGNPWLGATLCT